MPGQDRRKFMGYKRKGLTVEGDNIEALRLLVEAAQKPYISVEEGRILYSMGTHAFADLAKDAKATRRIGRRVLINVKVLNKYIETMFDEG